MKEKLKTVKSPEELIEIAKESGLELDNSEKEKLYSLLEQDESDTEGE